MSEKLPAVRATELAESEHAILTSSGLLDERTLVLTHGDTFGVFDRRGDLHSGPSSRQGLFFDGTRFLSGLLMTIDRRLPLLLSSGVQGENECLFAHQTNPDLRRHQPTAIERDSVHILRQIELSEGRCDISISLLSYAPQPVTFDLDLAFGADFADVFEVRGARRLHRGRLLPPRYAARCLELGYLGLDDRFRTTRIRFSKEPERIADLAVDPSYQRFGVGSTSEARRLIRQGAVKVNGRPAVGLDLPRAELAGALMQVGKRRFGRLSR
jgi:glycogen debranching enzyme